MVEKEKGHIQSEIESLGVNISRLTDKVDEIEKSLDHILCSNDRIDEETKDKPEKEYNDSHTGRVLRRLNVDLIKSFNQLKSIQNRLDI